MLSKSHLIKYFLILFALLFNHQIKASSLFVIDSYTVKDGLSHNTIWCALQDSYGFIWLGTNNGLNCFDGQKNTIYRTSSQERHNRWAVILSFPYLKTSSVKYG